jgi:hypothetical protein
MLRTVFLTTAALTLAVTTAFAAPTSSKLPNGAAVTTVEKGHVTVGSYRPHVPKGGKVIYDSIGSGYNSSNGWTISGPDSVIGEQIWAANQFTLTKKAKVTEVAAGVGYVTGSNSAQLAIYADASGLPGKMLWSADVSNLTTFGTSGTATADAKVKGVKLKANTPYWIAVQTDDNSSDTWDAWNLSNTADATLAENTGSGWVSYGSNAAGAVTIYGKK